jgi:hypothetical protein
LWCTFRLSAIGYTYGLVRSIMLLPLIVLGVLNPLFPFLGQSISGGPSGRKVVVDAPFGCPPVFYRNGSEAGSNLRDYIVSLQADALTVPNIGPRSVLREDCSPYPSSSQHSQHTILEKQSDLCAKPRVREITDYEEPIQWIEWTWHSAQQNIQPSSLVFIVVLTIILSIFSARQSVFISI